MCHDLAERAVPSVESVDGNGYMRTVATDGGHALIGVRPLKGADALELRVRGAPPGALFQLSATARRVFDLASEPAVVDAVLSSDPLLAPWVKRHRGRRIPGAWNAFECGVRAIVAEGVSRTTARRLAARLVDLVGIRISSELQGLTHLFPTPSAVATARLDGLGFGATQVGALRALARLALEGGLEGEAPVENVVAALTAVPGFGARAAQDVALYALGDPDAFSAADLVLRRAVSSPKGALVSPGELEVRAEMWRPWRGYAALHLFQAARDAADVGSPRERKTVPLRKISGATMRSARAS
jgi:AraC family transcriptional regulator of adaptative response / DNA-3-methyladenine glycosylase II